MPRARMVLAGLLLAGGLALPHGAEAGVVDFILEMSGPQMIGTGIACDIELASSNSECRLTGIRVAGDLSGRGTRGRLWLTLEGNVYLATGKDSEMRPFKFGHAQMFSYEPTLNLRSIGKGDIAIHHGVVGLSYVFLTGSELKRFDNVGMKLDPIAFTSRNHFAVAYNLRCFQTASPRRSSAPNREQRHIPGEKSCTASQSAGCIRTGRTHVTTSVAIRSTPCSSTQHW